jgi:hypothetical protein
MSFDARRGAAIVGASLLVVLAGAAGAHGPGEPHKNWFESLQRPDNHLHPERNTDHKSLYCCGAADIVKTKFMVEPGNERYPEASGMRGSTMPGPGFRRRRSSRISPPTTRPTCSCWQARSSVSCGPGAACSRDREAGSVGSPPARITPRPSSVL